MFIFIFLKPFLAYAGVPEAVNYLKNQTLDDWIVQALAAAGENIDPTPLQSFGGSSANDYSKRILSLVAAGQNPTTYTGINLVQSLKNFANGGQLGNPALLNDDTWGIMALRSAGLPATDSVIKNSVQYLLTNQNTDGGWSWGVGFDSDTNSTAAVLMALAEVGYTASDSFVQAGVSYLTSQQNSDAGWPYQLPCYWPGCEASDSASTAWVVSALNKLNLNAASWIKSGVKPQDFLLSLQTADGSFKWQAGDTAGSAGMTAYALIALMGKSYPVARGNYVGGSNTVFTPLADLEIKFDSKSINIKENQQFGLKIKLYNKGPNMAQAVEARLALPDGMEIIQSIPSEGDFDQQQNKWTFIRFNNYATAELYLVLTPRLGGEMEVRVEVNARELDIDKLNNTANLVVLVTSLEDEIVFNNDFKNENKMLTGQVLGEKLYSCEPDLTIEQAAAWSGFILSVNDSDTPWYIDPVSKKAYCVADSTAAYRALEIFGLGITNVNLGKIPVGEGEIDTVETLQPDIALANKLKGRILLQVESLGEAWYVNPRDGRRYYLANGIAAIEKFASWRLRIGK